MANPEALYPIREISRLTGVTPITLRAWERRYDLIEPVRTDSGHRLYTQEHVEFINQAVDLTKQGIPISKVKTVLKERKAQQKASRSSIDIDYVFEIKTACENLNFVDTQQLVEQLFVDLLENQVKQILVNVDLVLKKDTAVQVLWQSIVVPILSARILQGRRLLETMGRKNIYIGSLQGKQPVLQRIMGNTAIESGYNPMLNMAASMDNLIDTVRQLHCEALLLIAPEPVEEEIAYWQNWALQHRSVEVYYATTLDYSLKQTSLNFRLINFSQPRLGS
jgi:DNA-binding transcriptional MerR regulator